MIEEDRYDNHSKSLAEKLSKSILYFSRTRFYGKPFLLYLTQEKFLTEALVTKRWHSGVYKMLVSMHEKKISVYVSTIFSFI